MAVLSEVGIKSIGNSIKIQKYENIDNLLKTGPIERIFGPELEIYERFLKCCQKSYVIM